MGFWKDLFSGKSPKQQYKERLAKETVEKQDKVGVRGQYFKSRAFFEGKIDTCISTIDRKKKLFNECKLKEGENFDFSGLYDSFNIELLKLINAKYSKGEKVKDIIEYASALMETTAKFWLPDSECDYSNGGDMNFNSLYASVSIGILSKVDNDCFEDLSTVMQDKNFRDFLTDYFVNSQLPKHPIDKQLIVKDSKSLNFLVDVITTEDKKDAEQKVKIYLEKYFYTRENLDYIYNAHQFENGRNYFGYWAWEVGAIVKIRNLDDSSFLNSPYYPYDFVHWDDKNPQKKQILLVE